MGDQHQQQEPQVMHVSGSLEMPPGFRFNPSDEEIITFYLTPKVQQRSFTCAAMGEVDLKRTEPWELPGKANIGEKDWYFFCQMDRKYQKGSRMNRATKDGFWKVTGKDKEIYRVTTGVALPELIGMKKTLVFYTGRAPRGQKTSWIMHEYRLEGDDKLPYPAANSISTATMKSSSASKEEWVICRVTHKITGTKKAPTSPPYNNTMDNIGIDHSSIPMPLSPEFPVLSDFAMDQSSIHMPFPPEFPLLPDFTMDQSSIHMPLPPEFPMLPNFTMDPAGIYISTTDVSSLLAADVIPPSIAGMGIDTPQMNGASLGNSMAVAPQIPFYHQSNIGTIDASGFMAVPQGMPSLMVSQEGTGMSLDQTNAVEISSMVSIVPESTTTMDMDFLWRY